MSKSGLLTLTIRDKSALYLAYMPFIRNGGLFIPTSSSYRIGDEVFMLINSFVGYKAGGLLGALMGTFAVFFPSFVS